MSVKKEETKAERVVNNKLNEWYGKKKFDVFYSNVENAGGYVFSTSVVTTKKDIDVIRVFGNMGNEVHISVDKSVKLNDFPAF